MLFIVSPLCSNWKKSFSRMLIQRTITNLRRVISRSYQRPPNRKKGFIMNWWDKNWNPFLSNGKPNYINLVKLSMLIALLNLNVYQLYLNKLAMEAGEETAADRIYDFTGIDIGFRSVTLGKKFKFEEETGEKVPE